MTVIPRLTLDPSWNCQKMVNVEFYESMLGDGYRQLALGGDRSAITTWRVSKTGMTLGEKDAVATSLELYAGVDNFLWSPTPGEPDGIYTCLEWATAEQGDTGAGENYWRIDATFLLDRTGQCVELLEEIDEQSIRDMLTGALSFLNSYTRQSRPNIMNGSFLVANAFHDVLGRGGYFPGTSGTSEGQFAMIRACLLAFEQMGLQGYRQVAINCASTLEPILYGRPVPTNLTETWLCNWLFNLGPQFPAKGKPNANYLRYGYFDQVVNFVNGVGIIPSLAGIDGARLSDVYSVYPTTARLYYRNVFAPVVFGQPYGVEYWVSNYFLQGQLFRVFPTTASSAGTAPVPTTEPAGTIKLTTNYTGPAKVTYAAYSNTIFIQPNECFEAYPMWRRLDPGEIAFAVDSAWWAWDAYGLLFQHTGDPKWQRAQIITQNNTTDLSLIPNLTHWFKKEEDEDPFSYPGTQVIKVVSGQVTETGYTVSRVASGALKDTIRVDVTSNPQNTFPSTELQNFIVSAQVTDDVLIRAEIACNRETLAELVLSINPDPLNFSQLYKADVLVEGDSTLRLRTFIPEDFVLWNNQIVWWPTAATNPIYTYEGSGGDATAVRDRETISIGGGREINPVVWKITLDRNSGFAGAGFVLIQRQIRRPPRFYYRLTGPAVRLRITDGGGNRWNGTLPSTGTSWSKRSYNWNDFEAENSSVSNPNTEQPITNIEVESIDGSTSTLYIYWIAADERSEPQRLPTPVTTYKGSIVFRIADQPYTFWVGTFRPVGSPSDTIRWNPGVIPFTWNIRDGSILAWQGAGAPSSGYQSAAGWWLFGRPEYAAQVLEFLYLGQNWMTEQTGTVGLFAPTYYRNYWDGAEYAQGRIDEFGFDFADPNFAWIGYQVRVLETTARYVFLNPTDRLAVQVVLRGLTFYREHFLRFNTNQPPTNIIRNGYPLTLYHEPHAAAIIGRAAMYANLGGMSPSITYGVLIRCLRYVTSQYVSTGNMLGSFSAGQPTFTANNVQYREFFGFWQAEIIEFLSLLLKYKDQLRLPPCGTLI